MSWSNSVFRGTPKFLCSSNSQVWETPRVTSEWVRSYCSGELSAILLS